MTVPVNVLAAVRSIPHPRQETPMTMPLSELTEAQAERLAKIEAAEPAPESHEVVERVAQAIWEAADGYMSGVPWERAKANPFKEAKVFRQAVAAIDVMRGQQ